MPTRGIPIGTSPTTILAFNDQRTTASFTNNGAAVIFISEDETNIVAQGYPIAIGGALDLIRAFGDEPQNRWFAQVAAGSENMRVLEQFGSLPELILPGRRITGVEVA